MKNLKILALLSVLSVSLFACSEGTSTPTAGSPYTYNQGTTANPYGYPNQTGINGYNYNPYLQNQGVYPNTTYPNTVNTNTQIPQGVNPNAFLQYQSQMQAQAMFSCQARMSPYFYYQSSWNNNCGVRRQVTYTPSSCACIKAPCNCQQVISQCNNTTTTTTTTTSTVGTDGIDTNSKTLPLSLTGADAKAIYERLAKEEEDTNNRSKTKIRTGTIIKCMKDGKGKNNEDYACDFDIAIADGRIYEIYPVGKIGQPDVASDSVYSGKNLQIGGTGLNTNEALIKITGKIADYLFKKLPGDAKPGVITSGSTTAANIKSGLNIKCYQTTATVDLITECSVKIRVESGEILAQ